MIMHWRNYRCRWSDDPQRNRKLVIGVIFLCIAVEVGAQTYCEEKPKIVYYRRGQAALVNGASDEVANHVLISNVNKEFLACVSSRNVEWMYDGEGEPSKFQESSTVDIQKYDDGSISYCLTSQITFSNKQSDTELSRHTGRYTCREIGNTSNVASVYLFASRKNSPTFLQSRKTLTVPLSSANLTLIPMSEVGAVVSPENCANNATASGSGSNSSCSSEKNNNVETRAFTIPCVTTRPDVTAKLMKKGKNNKFLPYTGAAHQFDPKLGFVLNASSHANSEDLGEFLGEYKCVSSPLPRSASAGGGKSIEDESGNSGPLDVEDFVLITLVKAKTFKVFPSMSEVYTSGMLNLTCESEEPVIMKEVLPPSAQDIYSYLDEDDYSRDRSDDIVETTEKTEQTSHIANYMELAPAPGRTGEIQCLSEKTGKVLHTWKYKVIRKRADKLSGIKFNKREKSFTCKSKLGAPGRLSFVSCRTPSECRINRNCLMKSENCRGYSNSTRAFCERTTHFCGKIFYKGGSGLIRCIGEGLDEIRGFTDESAVDQGVRMGYVKLKASETALLQLAPNNNQGQQNQPSAGSNSNKPPNLYEGETVNVTLRMGYYYFLYPVQWAAKFRNGSTVQINPDSQTLQVDRLTRTVSASLTLPYTSATKFAQEVNGTGSPSNSTTDELPPSSSSTPQLSEIVALNALIPLRSSVDPSWKTFSLPLTVYGKEGLQQPPTDPESEEVLVEPPLHSQNQDQLPYPANSSSPINSTKAGDGDDQSSDGDVDTDPDTDDEENEEDDEDEEQQEAKITISPSLDISAPVPTPAVNQTQQEMVLNETSTSPIPSLEKSKSRSDMDPIKLNATPREESEGTTEAPSSVTDIFDESSGGNVNANASQNGSVSTEATTTVITSPSPSSPPASTSPSPETDAEGAGAVSRFPTFVRFSSSDTKGGQFHESIFNLKRSSLHKEKFGSDSDNDANKAQVETLRNNEQRESSGAVVKGGEDDAGADARDSAPLPTTDSPLISFSNGKGIYAGETELADEMSQSTTEQLVLADEVRADIETTTTYSLE